MQDVLEDYFGHQRARSGRSDNPTAQQFGYNDLTIASQRDIAPVIRGNVGGHYEVKNLSKRVQKSNSAMYKDNLLFNKLYLFVYKFNMNEKHLKDTLSCKM